MHKVLHSKDNVDRHYESRKEVGREHSSIKESILENKTHEIHEILRYKQI